jgi:hypothetical protein
MQLGRSHLKNEPLYTEDGFMVLIVVDYITAFGRE